MRTVRKINTAGMTGMEIAAARRRNDRINTLAWTAIIASQMLSWSVIVVLLIAGNR